MLLPVLCYYMLAELLAMWLAVLAIALLVVQLVVLRAALQIVW